MTSRHKDCEYILIASTLSHRHSTAAITPPQTMAYLDTKIPPPLIAALAAVGAYLTRDIPPQISIAPPLSKGLTLALAASGLSSAALAVLEFHRYRTTINPHHPESASALVSTGVFGLSRNPMYLGLALVLMGWMSYLQSLVGLFWVIGFVLYIHHWQIRPEERILENKFGDAFRQYKKRVRAWI